MAKKLTKAEGRTRHAEITLILKEIKPSIRDKENIPIIMSGDFIRGSHLDWIEETKKLHYGYTVAWPVSKEMVAADFIDSFRELNVNPLIDPRPGQPLHQISMSCETGLNISII